ncbi:MAG: 16S rRNA (guanine(527)-N(7))-methyltransferase RsmG [Bdellovibrionales bacterium]
MRLDDFCDVVGFDVSRESLDKLQIYHDLLIKWQKAINLVSPSTLDVAWLRHFADSAQLAAHIPDHVQSVMDWGSGAGFPVAVLAILRPDLTFYAVESDGRKCQFMRSVSRETFAPLRIENTRIEALEGDVIPDLVTARALAPVEALLGYAERFFTARPDFQMLLLKGETAQGEVDLARQDYDFDVVFLPSVTHPKAQILRLSNIVKR